MNSSSRLRAHQESEVSPIIDLNTFPIIQFEVSQASCCLPLHLGAKLNALQCP